jgi:hypothetical protein
VKQFAGLMGDQRTRKTFGEIVKGIIGAGSLIVSKNIDFHLYFSILKMSRAYI